MDPVFPTDESIAQRTAAVAASPTFRRILAALQLHQKKVLDIGCGYGEYLAYFGPGSEGITTTAHEVESGARAGLAIRLSNAEDIGDEPASFDAVWANNLFEHLIAPHAFLMGLRRVVREDGMLVLGVPVVPFPAVLMRARRFRGALASNHINFFTAKTLALTVERAGWKVESARPYVFGAAWLDRLASPFTPHRYLVARKDPNFQYPSKKRKEWEGDPRYARFFELASA